MKSVKCKGRSVEEAVAKALKILHAEKDDVVVEVLEEPEDRVFGLFVKPAVVKVTLKSNQDETESPLNDPVNQPLNPGMIQVVNGSVQHLADEEKRPTIVPSENITVLINGKPIEGETEVHPNDEIELKPTILERYNGSFHIYFDEQKVTAYLEIEPGYIERYAPIDTPPTFYLTINEQIIKEPYISFTKEDILNELKNRNVTIGIDEAAIEKALEKPDLSQDIIIAKGKTPVEGENGYVEFLVQYEISNVQPKLKEDGTVDYREIREIPMVDVGETIGIIHPPKEGEEGLNLENRPIKPKKVNEAIVKGRGIEIVDNKIIAVEKGTIRVNKRIPIYQIDIIQKLVHQGDVDLKSGNIAFVGDIEITGNVEENMTVESSERILIMQNVHGATVEAVNEIVVNRNIIRSKLVAGKIEENEIVLKEKTGELLNEIKSFKQSLLQLILANRRANAGPVDMAAIVRVLVQQKYTKLTAQLNEYFKLLHEVKDYELFNLNEMIDMLYKTFFAFDRKLLDDEMLFLTIQEKLGTLYRYYEQKLEPTSKVTIGQAQQSEVFCNGDIYLTGRGAYNSIFHAEGKFVTNGFIRGGSIFARKGIEVNEVGSGFGVETLLHVPATETIRINRAKEDTILQIGKRKYRFVKERTFIEARLDETGTLVLA